MKKFLFILAAFAIAAQAQTDQPSFIKGEVGIKYGTRVSAAPQEGQVDAYSLKINVSNSAIFGGNITQRPHIASTFGTAQTGLMTYSVDSDVVNPKNPAQTKNVGKFFGSVPVTEKNVYLYDQGNLKAGIFGIGSAKGFDSKFGGVAIGKPPAVTGFFDKMKKEAISITKQVQGKKVSISVTKYDKMEFQNIVLGAGPVQVYPESTVSGSMLYDYGRSAWHFQNVTVTYTVDGKRLQDNITGSIRWIEHPNRKSNGEGAYEFDIRVNEPAATEGSIFAAVADEASFFETDNANPALTGSMKYKDTVSNDKVINSAVNVDLIGNKLTKQQTMYLAKLLFFVAIGPLNSE